MSLTKLNIAEIILSLRREKGVTQEELADFLGVTKASVSKWETKQSYPDILLLPQIAAYFNISIDDLLGYEPQLSKEQIKKYYRELAEAFSQEPFDEVMQRSRMLVKEYYSCYPFLFEIAILWINHVSLLSDQEKQKEMIQEIIELCHHIERNCTEMGLNEDAIGLASLANLQLGNAKEVIETLEPLNNSMRIGSQTVGALIKAYQMVGNQQQADYYNQITIYTSLVQLLSQSSESLTLHLEDYDYCLKTIRHVEGLIELFDILELHPNLIAQFYYQAAICYATHNKEDKALEALKHFTQSCIALFDQGMRLHGDAYFTSLDKWIENFTLGSQAVRSQKLVIDAILLVFDHPLFTTLSCQIDIKQLKQLIRKRVNLYEH